MQTPPFLEGLIDRASQHIKTIVLPEGEDKRVLDAAHFITSKNAVKVVILGNIEEITSYYSNNNWSLENITLINPETSEKLNEYANLLFELRKAKGMTLEQAQKMALNYNYFGTLMLKSGDADGMVSGANHSTADTIRPALQIIKSAHKNRSVSATVLIVSNNKPYLLSDGALIINPTSQEMADIAISSAETAIQFGIEPTVAMLSFSTYGSGKGGMIDKTIEATKLAIEMAKDEEYKDVNIQIDGELQADAALDLIVANKKAPTSSVAGHANVLVVPCLEVGNIAYKLLQRLGGCEAYGPLLQGLNAPINDLSRGALTEDIVGTIAITAIQATH